MIEPGLAGKVALVTGANNPFGIGAAIANAFTAQGASVFVTALPQPPEMFGIGDTEAAEATAPGEAFYRARNADSLDAVVHQLRQHGGTIGTAEIDLADVGAIPMLFDLVEKALGPVDVLVNNAAHAFPDSLSPVRGEGWADRLVAGLDAVSHDRHFAVNSRAVALTMAEFARRHVARGATLGRIVNISTDAADAFPGEVSYGASKAALESYSRSAARELGRHGITVNIVAPGPIQTGWIPEALETEVAANTPLGRVGRPGDVADVVLFLASEQARWVTGQRLWVGGGHRM